MQPCVVVLFRVLVLGMAGLLGGCFYASDIAPTHLASEAAAPPKVPDGVAVVAVRWPMTVDESALSVIAEVYEDKFKPGFNLGDIPYAPEGYRRIPEVSTYYALELYEYLRANLPPESVFLEPYAVTAGEEGALVYKPIFDNHFPVAFALDVVEMPDSAYGLHAEYLSTTFRLAVAPSASPQTCGLVAGNKERAGWTSFEVQSKDEPGCSTTSLRGAPPHTVMDIFARKSPKYREKFTENPSLPVKLGQVLVWPATAIELSNDYVRKSAHGKFVAAQSQPHNPWLGNIARVVAQAAATLDLSRVTEGEWAQYVSYYDPSLAQNAASDEAAARRRAIAVLANAEKRWSAKQDEKIAEALLSGRFGQGFRQRRVADSAAFDKIRKRSMASAMSLFAVGMSSGLFSAGAVPVNNLALLQGVTQNAAETAQFNKALMDQVAAELGPETAARDQIVRVEVAGMARDITAESRTQLREQLRQFYRERFPSPAK